MLRAKVRALACCQATRPKTSKQRVDAYMAVSGLSGDYTVTVDSVAIETGAGTFNARSVAVNYTYQFTVLGGIGGFFGGDFTTIPLRAVSVMRTEAQAGGS